MNLYEVQDSDRPIYVVAESWTQALEAWKEQMIFENESTPGCGVPEPSGIRLVAENRGDMPDLLLPRPARTEIQEICRAALQGPLHT